LTCSHAASISNVVNTNTANFTVPILVGAASGSVINYASVGGGGDPFNGGAPPVPGATCADPTHCANVPTEVQSRSAALIKSVRLSTDADGNGVPTPGDTLTYTVAFANDGTAPLPAAQIADTIPANTTIVAGSATVVSTFNAAPVPVANAAFNGTTNTALLAAATSTIAGGGNIVVAFRVTINAGFHGVLDNRATATATGLVPPLQSSTADSSTTGLPAGITIPPGSLPQGPGFTPNTGPPIAGPTVVNVVTPGLGVFKSVDLTTDADGNGVPSPGDTLTWTVFYANTGDAPLPAAQIADSLPAGTTIVAGSAAIASASSTTPAPTANTAFDGSANRNLIANTVTVAPGGVIAATFRVTINAGFGGTLSNRATGTGTGLPPAGVLSSAIDNTTTGVPTGVVVPPGSVPQGPAGTPNTGGPINRTTDVIVTPPTAFGIKSVKLTTDADGNGVLTPGDTLTWTIAYKNSSTIPIVAAQITDPLPTNTTIVAGSATIVNDTGLTPAPTANAAFDGAASKTLLATPVRIAPNGIITVSFRTTLNAGDTAPSTNRAVLTGNGLPAAGIPTNAADNTTTQIPTGLSVPPGSLPQGPGGAPNTGPPLDQPTIATPATIALAGAKSARLTTDADGNGVPSPGDTLTWTVTYANTGTAPIPALRITDAIPANVTIVAGSATLVTQTGVTPPAIANAAFDGNGTQSLLSNSVQLAAGGAITISFRTTINAGTTGTLLNRALATGGGVPTGGVPSGAVDNSTTGLPPGTIVPPGSLPQGPGGAPNTGPPINGPTRVVVSPSSAVGIKSVQLTTDADGNGVLTPGDTLTWTITYANDASVAIPNAQITDTLDAKTTLVTGSETVVAATGIAPAPAPNKAFDGNAAKGLLVAPITIAPGGVITVSFRVTLNAGATGPVLDRAILNGSGLPAAGIPTNAADNGTKGLPPGITVPPGSLPQGPNGKPNTGSSLNAPVFATPATVSADGIKSVAITGGPPAAPGSHGAAPGNVLTWTIQYGNTGTAPISNAQITDTLPQHTTFVPGSVAIASSHGVAPAPAPNAPYNGAAAKNLLAAPVTLAPGSLIVVSFAVTIDPGFAGAIANRATLSGGGLPAAGVVTDAADDSTTALPPTAVVPPASLPQGPNGQPNSGPPLNAPTNVTSTAPNLSPLQVQKSVDREVAASGDRLIYTIVASNLNSIALGATTIVDIMPGGVAYANGSTRIDGVPFKDPLKAGSTLSWLLPATVAKGQHTVIFAAVIAPGIPVGTIMTNTANANAKVPGTNTTLASPNAQAQTRVIGGIFNDCVTILGRVFVDKDNTGRFSRDDVGIPNVRIFLESGEYVVTDRYGKYNFACVRPGMHVLRLDTLTLPPGTAPYNVRNYDDPRSVQRLAHGVLDAGLIQNINFAIRGAP